MTRSASAGEAGVWRPFSLDWHFHCALEMPDGAGIALRYRRPTLRRQLDPEPSADSHGRTF